jgi:multidrug efflux pump subunit AcrA (membrane-fusion protein)
MESNTEGFGPTELVEALKIKTADLEAQLEQSREVAREQAERAQARLDEQRNHYDERLVTQRDRWHAEVQAKQERIEALLATDQGQAYAEVEDMKRQIERANAQAERALERAREAESEKHKAWNSVQGAPDIHPHDPRVAHIWRKASRIATHAGFCTEYDRIADSLGIPEIEFDYSGHVSVRVSAYVSVPVSGTATRAQIADGEVDWEIDNDEIVAQLESDSIEWEVDEVDIEADDE